MEVLTLKKLLAKIVLLIGSTASSINILILLGIITFILIKHIYSKGITVVKMAYYIAFLVT